MTRQPGDSIIIRRPTRMTRAVGNEPAFKTRGGPGNAV
jgi:hypothetical protein